MAKIIRARRYVHHLETDVLTEARRRLAHIFDQFDSVAVAFSGGKDSLVVLNLVREYHEQHGLGKVEAIFRDEEVIPFSVVRFLEQLRVEPWLNLRWLCVPMASHKMLMGTSIDYIQWDPQRGPDNWMREKPPWAILDDSGRVYDQHTMDDFQASFFSGKVCILTGIRSAESLQRYQACMSKIHHPYIVGSSSPNAMLGRVIYDWSEKDVFRYFYDKGIKYCSVYDAQTANRDELRVATALHAQASKRFDKLKTLEPEYYQRILEVFPEYSVHSRYYRDLSGALFNYPPTWAGVLSYIRKEMSDGRMQKMALDLLKRYRKKSKTEAFYRPETLIMHLLSTGVDRPEMVSDKNMKIAVLRYGKKV